MIILVLKLVLFASLLGMFVMAVTKIPALRELEPKNKSKKRNDTAARVFKLIEKGTEKSASATKIGVKNFSSKIKKLTSKERKRRKELSSDYWEKVRKEDAD